MAGEDTPTIRDWHGEVMTALERQYAGWDFAAHNPGQNVEFAHNFATWVSDMFPLFSDARSEEFNGQLLPDNLKPLVSHIWRPRGEQHLIYSSELYVRVYKRGEHTKVDTQIEGFDELVAEGLTFDEIIQKLMAEKRTVTPGTTIVDPAVAVSLYVGSQTGLELMLEPDHIELAVFGEAGKTREFSHFMLRHYDNQTLLAENAARIAILGAERADYCLRNDIDRLQLTDFDQQLFPGIDGPSNP